MNRRTFAQTLAGAAVASAVPTLTTRAAAASAPPPPGPVTFSLSVMLWTVFKDLPFEQRIAKIAEAGYNQVELVGEYKKWSKSDFDNAAAAAKRLGIKFDATAGLNHGIANPATTDAFLEELKQAFTPMEALSCSAMIVLSGNVVPGLSREQQHQASIETLKRAAGVIEGKTIAGEPIRLLLECIDPKENPKFYMNSASEAIDVLHAVNHPQVRFLYDIYHEQIGQGDLISKLDKGADVIDLIHVADVPGRHQPGTGEINYTNIFKKLGAMKYKGVVAMEFYPTGDEVSMLKDAKTLALTAGQG
jgi:hydroxypyruvate isomerase